VLLSVGDGFDGFCWVIVLVETTQADGFFHLPPGVSGYDLAGNSTEGSIVTIAALFPILDTSNSLLLHSVWSSLHASTLNPWCCCPLFPSTYAISLDTHNQVMSLLGDYQ
jgi:hypothetical protein